MTGGEWQHTFECGCQIWLIDMGTIGCRKQCPLHKNAAAMLRGLEAAIAALDSTASFVTASAYAAIWARCNGCDGGPDIQAIVTKAKGK